MLVFELILILLFITIIITEAINSMRIIRAEHQQKLFTDQSISIHSSLGWVGFSVICHRVEELEHIENLLNVKYDSYEVIAIIDSRLQTELYSALILKYRMLEVNNPITNTSEGTIVRSIYRSAERRYRRLIIVDSSTEVNSFTILNEVLKITSYSYIIPITGNYYLRPYAIENIAIILSDATEQTPELLLSNGDAPCYIFKRETIILHGGFSTSLPKKISQSNILHTNQSFIHKPIHPLPKNRHIGRLAAGLFVALAIVWIFDIAKLSSGNLFYYFAYHSILITSAALATTIVLKAIAHYQFIACGIDKCSVRTMLCYFHRLK